MASYKQHFPALVSLGIALSKQDDEQYLNNLEPNDDEFISVATETTQPVEAPAEKIEGFMGELMIQEPIYHYVFQKLEGRTMEPSKRGRKTLSKDDYREKAINKIQILEAKLGLISDQPGSQWYKLRKRLLMHKLRLKTRDEQMAAKKTMKD